MILIANIIRIFFWLGNRFETRQYTLLPYQGPLSSQHAALLVQSLLLIIAHLCLLSICLHYAPQGLGSASDSHDNGEEGTYAPLTPVFDAADDPSAAYEARTHQGYRDHSRTESASDPPTARQEGQGFLGRSEPGGRTARWKNNLGGLGALRPGRWEGGRPWQFWQWEGYGTYLEFLAGLILVLGFLQMIFGRWMWYIDVLGFAALILGTSRPSAGAGDVADRPESTLPIPQFIANYRRKSCYGFRSSTLAGWLFGDLFK